MPTNLAMSPSKKLKKKSGKKQTTFTVTSPNKGVLSDGDHKDKMTLYRKRCQVIERVAKNDEVLDAVLDILDQRESERLSKPSGATAETHLDKADGPDKIDEDFYVSFVANHSDLTKQEIIKTKTYDPQGPKHLYMFGCPWKPGIVFPSELKERKVLDEVSEQLWIESGRRTLTFKASGLWYDNGRLDWKKGVYTPEVNQERQVVMITHINGRSLDVDPKKGITDEWVIRMNAYDWKAHWFMEGLKPSPVVDMFKASKQGPFENPQYKNGSQEYMTLVKTAVEKVARARAAAGQGGAAPAAEIKKELGVLKKSKATAGLAEARRKANLTLGKIKAARTASYKPSTASGSGGAAPSVAAPP